MEKQTLKVGLAQFAPVWMNRGKTVEKAVRFAEDAANQGCEIVVLGGEGCCLMRKEDFPVETLHLDKMLENAPAVFTNGGTCLAVPDSSWIIEPVCNEEKLLTAEIDHRKVREERQNFDSVGHYSRPDVLQLTVNRQRQSILKIED